MYQVSAIAIRTSCIRIIKIHCKPFFTRTAIINKSYMFANIVFDFKNLLANVELSGGPFSLPDDDFSVLAVGVVRAGHCSPSAQVPCYLKPGYQRSFLGAATDC